jgi:hypothetical protein
LLVVALGLAVATLFAASAPATAIAEFLFR